MGLSESEFEFSILKYYHNIGRGLMVLSVYFDIMFEIPD
jgi:hypothetical protein